MMEIRLIAALSLLPAIVFASAKDVFFTSPDFMVYSPALGTDRQVNEHFHVLASPNAGVMHAFWTQESWECSSDMHIMRAKSADGGKTWSASQPVRDSTGKVIAYPRAPCPMYDFGGDAAASGRYFALFTDKVDPKASQWEGRGPLHLYRGTFDPVGEQPVRFEKGEVLLGRSGRSHYGNSCYSSSTIVDGKCVLWFPDNKFHLLGKVVK